MTRPRAHRWRWAVGAAIIAVLAIAPTAGAQATSVAPQALLVTDRAPSGAVTVLNPNDVPLDVQIGMKYGYVTTDSVTGATIVRLVDDSIAAPNSAVPILRFSPARFRLAPGATQLVRVVAIVRPELADGEYWARLTIMSRRDERPADVAVTGATVTGELSLQVQSVIPVYFRKGPVVTSLSARVDSMQVVSDGLAIDATFTRGGTGASVGALTIEALDGRGDVLASGHRQLAVYHALSPRLLLRLSPDALRRVARVRLSVNAKRPDLPEGLVLPFTPVVAIAPVSRPTTAPPKDEPSPHDEAAAHDGPARDGPNPAELDLPAPDDPGPHALEPGARGPHAARDDGTSPDAWGRAPATVGDTIPKASGTHGILAVVIGGSEVGTIFTLEGTVLGRIRIPLRAFARLLGISLVSPRPDELRISYSSPSVFTATVNRRTGHVLRRVGTQSPEQRVLGDSAITTDEAEWFVEVADLPALTNIVARIDEASASLLVETPRAQLPRVARPRSGTTLAGDAPEFAVFTAGAPLRRGGILPSGLALTYNLAVDNHSGDHAVISTVGTSLLGGGLSTQFIATRFGLTERTSTSTSWLGGNPNNPLLRQIRLGTGSSTGLLPLVGRGVSLTNAPFLRTAALGTIAQSGSAPPGAEIEISRNGQVIGVATADSAGRWTLPVPVTFGENAVEVAIYTGDGVRRTTQMFGLETELIPSRRFEYGVTVQDNDVVGSECRRNTGPCGWVGNADLRYGLSSRLTARAGIYGLRARDGSPITESRPYVSVAGSPLNWLQMRGEAASSGWFRARAVLQPSMQLRVEFNHEALDSASAPFFVAERARFVARERSAQLVVRPFGQDLGRVWLTSMWRENRGVRGEGAGLSATIGTRAAGVLWQLTSDQQQQRDIFGTTVRARLLSLSLTMPQWRRGPTLLRRAFTTVNGAVDGEQRLQILGAQSSIALGQMLQFQLGADWRRIGGSSFRVQLQHQGPFATFVQTLTRNGGGETQSSSLVMGAASLRAGASPVRLSNDFVALRSAVSGVAFEDLNGNGRPDGGEPRLANLNVRVGRTTFRTDASGAFVATGLPVLDAMAVSPDMPSTFSTDGRSLVPAQPVQWALLVPFGETRVNLAYVAAASGVAYAPSGSWDAALVPLDGRAKRIALEVFDDGLMPLGPVPAGRYRLELQEHGVPVVPRTLACVVTLDAHRGIRVRVPEHRSPDAYCEEMR